MSEYLLDTNIALLALSSPEKLTEPIRAALLGGENVLSVVSYWEVVLKSMKGKLDVGDPRSWWSSALEQLQATSLTVRAEHVTAVSSLPVIHQDPFDRILIAQATVAGLTLVTTDREMKRYETERTRIMS